MLCAAEHFTGVLGHWALNNSWDDMDVDPTLADFYRWHGAEEVEHRHVSYNVAKYFGMDYFAQAVSGRWSRSCSLMVLRGTQVPCPRGPGVTKPRAISGWCGSCASGSAAPSHGRLSSGSASAMLSRDYNPVDEGSTAQAVAYLAASPAARARYG